MTALDRPAGCKARLWSDEWVCTACRLRWDMHDTEPPACNPEKHNSARVRLMPGRNPNPKIWRP